MTAYPQPSTSHWESRNGYTPPPRLQQLRARDSQQQLYQQQRQSYYNQGPVQQTQQQEPPQNRPASTGQIPDMSHTRSPSFFGFNRNKQGNNSRPDLQPQRSLSPNSNVPSSPNSFPSVSAATMQAPPPSTQNNAFGTQPQQQANLLSPQQPFNQQQPLPPIPPQQQQAQRPQAQPYQGGAQNAGHLSTNSQPNAAPAGPVPEKSAAAAPAPPPLHPEIRSVVQLTIAHAHKIYFSGPLVRRLERQPDGQKPHKDDGWTEVWAQLGGTTLSVWDMKEIQEASKQGKEVPPSYINVTDAVCSPFCSFNTPLYLTHR